MANNFLTRNSQAVEKRALAAAEHCSMNSGATAAGPSGPVHAARDLRWEARRMSRRRRYELAELHAKCLLGAGDARDPLDQPRKEAA